MDKELSIIKSKKGAILGLIKRLDADADKFVSKAGITDDVVEMQKLLTKANSFEQSVKKKNDNSWFKTYHWEDGDRTEQLQEELMDLDCFSCLLFLCSFFVYREFDMIEIFYIFFSEHVDYVTKVKE